MSEEAMAGDPPPGARGDFGGRGVKDGGMAMEAYQEAVEPGTTGERKVEIDAELRAYCALDTAAMIEIWRVFSGQIA